MKLNTYLNFGGNCEQAFRYYEKHLGGTITMMMTHGEIPGAGDSLPADRKSAILHARMTIGETELLASDVPPEHFKPLRSAYLSLSVDSTQEAELVYSVLADGGEVLMPMEETFWAFRFGTVRDRFGCLWMIGHERPRP